jgi:hypothetical protein
LEELIYINGTLVPRSEAHISVTTVSFMATACSRRFALITVSCFF